MIKGDLTLKEASDLSGISVEALKKRCQEGRLRGALKKGNGWFVPQSEIVVDNDNIADGSLNFINIIIEASDTARVGVTLFVGGSVISGDLISRKEYLQNFKHHMLKMLKFGDDDTQTKLKETTTTYFDDLISQDEKGAMTFIHLDDVEYYDGGTPHDIKPANLRIRTSSIDGFILGRRTKDV
jgi:hypothetical protein